MQGLERLTSDIHSWEDDYKRAYALRLLQEVYDLERELAAYKRAKSENDERFMLERDEARAEVARLNAVIDQTDTMPRYPACRAAHPTNDTVVPCCLDVGHIGRHWSTTGCAGSVCTWDNQ